MPGAIRKPADSERGGKQGIAGSNVQPPKDPPKPHIYGGKKG